MPLAREGGDRRAPRGCGFNLGEFYLATLLTFILLGSSLSDTSELHGECLAYFIHQLVHGKKDIQRGFVLSFPCFKISLYFVMVYLRVVEA